MSFVWEGGRRGIYFMIKIGELSQLWAYERSSNYNHSISSLIDDYRTRINLVLSAWKPRVSCCLYTATPASFRFGELKGGGWEPEKGKNKMKIKLWELKIPFVHYFASHFRSIHHSFRRSEESSWGNGKIRKILKKCEWKRKKIEEKLNQ